MPRKPANIAEMSNHNDSVILLHGNHTANVKPGCLIKDGDTFYAVKKVVLMERSGEIGTACHVASYDPKP